MLFDRLRCLVAGVAALVVAGCGAGDPDDAGRGGEEPIRVLAAASLIDVMEEIGAAWEAEGHDLSVMSFAASSTLARQIEQGVPGDVFVSADAVWMDYLTARDFIDGGSVREVAGNALVLIAPAASVSSGQVDAVELSQGFDLDQILGDGRLALADEAVPAGRYGREALQSLDLMAGVEGRVVLATDVRSVLRYVELGEARLGVVYQTDALAAAKSVDVVGRFPGDAYESVVYPAGRIFEGRGGDEFLDFLGGDVAKGVFEAHGFSLSEVP